MLKKIFKGVKAEDRSWRRGVNIDLTQLYGTPIGQLVKAVKHWLGHVVRMPDTRWAKNVLQRGRSHRRKVDPEVDSSP